MCQQPFEYIELIATKQEDIAPLLSFSSENFELKSMLSRADLETVRR